MVEIGLHLIEPPTVQTLASPVTAASPATITLNASTSSTLPASPLPATEYLYAGAMLVLGWQASDAEVITVISVTGPNTFTANVVNNHAAGETLFGATFPTQQPTDPVFTQSEIIGYIAQAQNEFLTKVPLVFSLFSGPSGQQVSVGQTYYTLPGTTIELERVAVQSNPPSTTFAIASISRTSNVVTCVLAATSNTDQWTPLLPIQVFNVADNSYNSLTYGANGFFTLLTVSADGLTLTWAQTGANSSSSGGSASRTVLTRLYESSQEQLSLNQPWWGTTNGTPKQFFEDRSGVYGWGVVPPPDSNYWVELLCSVRGSEGLNLLSSFQIPDCFVYAVKWLSLSYAWSKAGIQRSPTMERFAKGKFDHYCLLADRFLRAVMEQTGKAGR